MKKVTGFHPVADQRTRVVVLGTMPGGRSLELQQYYGHPQNRFWRVMSEVLGLTFSEPYDQRIALLKGAGIGLWDVLHACERPNSSLDSKIIRGSEIANDFSRFLDVHPAIQALALNGKKAADLYQRLVERAGGRQADVLELPSTSPANTSVRFDELVTAWRVVTRYLD